MTSHYNPKWFFFLYLLLFLPCCTPQKPEKENGVFDLVESTTIIKSLIHQNKLGTILKDTDPKGIELLINNMSPAIIAFESEVLASTIPTIIYFYDPEIRQQRNTIHLFEQVVKKHRDLIKVVLVDAQALFSVVEKARIEALPAASFIKNRQEVYFTDDITPEELEEGVLELLTKNSSDEKL